MQGLDSLFQVGRIADLNVTFRILKEVYHVTISTNCDEDGIMKDTKAIERVLSQLEEAVNRLVEKGNEGISAEFTTPPLAAKTFRTEREDRPSTYDPKEIMVRVQNQAPISLEQLLIRAKKSVTERQKDPSRGPDSFEELVAKLYRTFVQDLGEYAGMTKEDFAEWVVANFGGNNTAQADVVVFPAETGRSTIFDTRETQYSQKNWDEMQAGAKVPAP